MLQDHLVMALHQEELTGKEEEAAVKESVAKKWKWKWPGITDRVQHPPVLTKKLLHQKELVSPKLQVLHQEVMVTIAELHPLKNPHQRAEIQNQNPEVAAIAVHHQVEEVQEVVPEEEGNSGNGIWNQGSGISFYNS
jgi:hypothetical protein